MSRRSVLGLMYRLQGVQEQGGDCAPVLSRYGLDLASLNPDAEIDRGLEIRVTTEVFETLLNPLAGLKVGEHFALAGYGPFAMLLMSCARVYEAVQVGMRYQQLTFLFGTLDFLPGDKASALVLNLPPLPPRASRIMLDSEISGTYKLLRDMQQAGKVRDMAPSRVDIPYARPADASVYETYFQCPVHFGSDAARIWLDNNVLGYPLATADEVAHALYARQCDRLLQQRERADDVGIADRALSYLALFHDGFPSVVDTACALGVSERTLRRQLSREGQSFRQLLDQARMEKAKQWLLESVLPVELLARQLGYGEPASFIRAFRRWTGTTPAAFRRQQNH